MSVDDGPPPPGSTDDPHDEPMAGAGPLGLLPQLSRRGARVASRLGRLGPDAGPAAALGWLVAPMGESLTVGLAEYRARAAGSRRAGVVAQFSWPRLATRLAVGLETPLVHAIVDRMLGFDRPRAESRRPVSPVEWGVLTFVAAESLRRLAAARGPLGAWDLVIDRVNPEPFETAGLGAIATVRWPVSIGEATGSLRLWLPEALLTRWLAAPSGLQPPHRELSSPGLLSTTWHAQAGTVFLPRGMTTLRAGGVLPLSGSRLTGTAAEPSGMIELSVTLAPGTGGGRFVAVAGPVAGTNHRHVQLLGTLRFDPSYQEPPAVSQPDPSAAPTDVPVTLVVELGRTNLTLARLADLRPGDVIELNRHSREPVELTSGGRLVARGELVQIDTELGVRVTHVLL